jgi:predicted alpha/beta-hydrolase family hydrolase
MQSYTYSYNQISNSSKLTVIVHGGGEGIESNFIQKIRNKFNSQSTLLIQMPFINRGEEGTSTKTFDEEIKEIKEIINSIDKSNIKSIKFIGKSIGALVLLNYIYQHYLELSKFEIDLTMLGFLVEFTKLDITKPLKINIIQGTNDKYGTILDVQNIIESSKLQIELSLVENGDHSYRDVNKNPIFQDDAIALIK